MKTTSGAKISITESGDKVKKKWIKPEIEIISKDNIESGSARFYTEAQRSATFNRSGYS